MNPLDPVDIQDHQPPTHSLEPEQRVTDLTLAYGRSEEGHVFFPKQSFFFSIFIHLGLILALLWGFYQPNKRPIHAVNHWAVNLITEWNSEPKGVRKGNLEGATLALPRSIQERKLDRLPPLPAEISSNDQATGDVDFLINPGEIVPADKTKERPGEETSSAQAEKRWKVMKDTADHPIQMGQYLFTMKTQDPMVGIKIRYYQKNLRVSLESMIMAAIPEGERPRFQGKKAAVQVFFPTDGDIPALSLAQESDAALARILEENIDWHKVMSPSSYALPFKAMNVQVVVNDAGNITVRVELL